MSTQEAALLEANRNKANGQFGSKQHSADPSVTIGAGSHQDELAFGPAACAARARKALLARGDEDDTESMILDMLTDLRHLAREEGIDIDERFEASLDHFNEEMDDHETSEARKVPLEIHARREELAMEHGYGIYMYAPDEVKQQIAREVEREGKTQEKGENA